MFKDKKTSDSNKFNKLQGTWIEKIWHFPRQLLAQNTGTKLLSLTLAILFWIFVMDHVDPEITRVFENVPIQLVNTQELDQNNLKIMNQSDYFVDVEVAGRRNNVLNLNSKSIYLWADLRSVSNGTNKIFVNSSVNSDSVSIKLLTPKEIVFTIDRVVSIPKPIKIVTSDNFKESLYEESMEINPFEINVVGPESLVNSVDSLIGTISVSALNEDYSREITLSPYTKEGVIVNGVNLEKNSTTLSMKVGKEKTLEILPDVEGTPKEGYEVVSVTVKPNKLSVRGQIEKIDALEKLFTDKIILVGDESESLIIEKDIVLPDGVVTTNGEKTVQVELLIEPIQTKEFVFELKDIEIAELNSVFDIDFTNSDSKIVVKVVDIESKISKLKKEDIHLNINCSNVSSIGDYRLKVNVSDALQFKELLIEPISVDLKIIEKSSEN